MKKALLFLVLFPFLTSVSSCKKKYSIKNDKVIVVGAGISGLAVASELNRAGLDVTILEAQEEAGGRIKTDYSLAIPFDIGASWIHGPDGNPITPLALSAGADTFLTDDEDDVLYGADGAEIPSSEYESGAASFEEAVSEVENGGAKNQSFETVFNALYPQYTNDNLWKFMLSAFLEFDTGGDISDLSSVYFYDDDSYWGSDVIITNGYDKVTDHLVKGLDIRYNERVGEIDYSKNKSIMVTTGSGEYEADVVIVTVPLGVLKKGAITFKPGLPDYKQEAMGDLQMGTVNKYLLVWDTVFWDSDIQYIGYTPDTKGKFNFFLNVNKFAEANALMTFTFGEYSKTAESMSDAAITTEIMNHLRTIYGASIPEPVSMLRSKWNTNENSYGSYSFVAKGGTSDAYDDLAEELDDRLFFAGEHTSFDYRGTVHGAYNSGIREAEKVLKLFK